MSKQIKKLGLTIKILLVGLCYSLSFNAASAENNNDKETQDTAKSHTQENKKKPENNTDILSANEPIYFVIGGSEDIKARFQFSFKYRIFDDDSTVLKHASWLENFHFAYTQTSLWNLSEDSAPFEDSSYRPSFFVDLYQHNELSLKPAFIRTGYEHESNGQAGDVSRSIDTAYIWPFWGGTYQGTEWFVAPKIWSYLAKGNHNSDISDYRGYSEIWFQYGNENSWLIATKLRPGKLGHPSHLAKGICAQHFSILTRLRNVLRLPLNIYFAVLVSAIS